MSHMSVHNLDAGVLLSLKAYKVEKGMAPAAAESWAKANLAEGIARVRSVLRLPDNGRDFENGTRTAFAALKTWSQSTP